MRFFAALALVCACVACGKDDDGGGGNGGGNGDGGGKKASDVTGEWCLSAYSTKAVTIGSESVDVYISFTSSAFELYQKVGEGRYRKYSGTYTLSSGTLSGQYSDGKAWGTSYEVTRKGDSMTLTAGVEVSTYTKKAIPSEVKNSAI